MARTDKYFWFKCNHDFFESHKMRCVERSLDFNVGKLDDHDKRSIAAMAIGYVYVKLMAESCTHNGELRQSDTKPYTMKTLARVIGCPQQLFEYAMECFVEYELATIGDDGTIHLTDLAKYLGKESEAAERMRRHRSNAQKAPKTPQEAPGETKTSDDTDKIQTPQNPVSDDAAISAKTPTEPPSRELVVKIATSGMQMRGGKPIPKDFVESWYDRMMISGWKDVNGVSCIKPWRVKLAYAWEDEQRRDKNKAKEQAEAEKLRKEQEEQEFRWNKMRLEECDD